MSVPIVSSGQESASSERAWRLRSLWDVAAWAVASLIAMFLARLVRDDAALGDLYLPSGNDSFYHARRILDAAFGQGLRQFDARLHAPDGDWVAWPWAYDYLLAKATQLAVWLQPSLDPMAFLTYVPVAWIAVNAALLLAVCRAIRLSPEMRLIAMLSFAISPLTQLLHAAGMIDHHYVEHTFVLLAIWLGSRWFQQPGDRRRALALGIALGIAPGFHNGLFILQLLPLAGVLALWLRGTAPSGPALRAFAVALVVTTQVVLLPSEPYRRFMFEFGLLSWFHFYVALCTAAAMVYMGWQRLSMRSFAGLAALCAVLAAPLIGQVLVGAGFIAGDFSILSDIREAQSPLEIMRTFGAREVLGYYSWMLVLVPLLLAYYVVQAFRETTPDRIYYALAAVCGLAMLLSQQRLQYFGFFAFVTSGLLIVDALRRQHRWHRGVVFAAVLALTVLAYQPALRERLFVVYAPGADSEYASAFAIFLDLQSQCAADPGVVLASPDDGNAILFHSACSVIANNFILRPEDAEHIGEVQRLMRLSPAEIRRERPDVKYVFVRAADFSILADGVARLATEIPIAKELLGDQQPPAGYYIVKTVRWSLGDEDRIYARLYKISGE
ncbi:MAG TPA: hypothetical protein VM692_11445 [Gammaproteobacteria bacterium]|nr:hypothetical protein [Gammaproteobacteria bacterium]